MHQETCDASTGEITSLMDVNIIQTYEGDKEHHLEEDAENTMTD